MEQIPGTDITAVKINGRLLIERKDFISFFESRDSTDRLVNDNKLTSFHSNGQKKIRNNGKMPNSKTYYCLREWSQIDFNA